MKATRKHKDIRSRQARQSSYHYRIIKAVANVVGVIIGLIVAVVMWVVIRPILRGVGWLISILTIIAVIYWLMTF